jgi:hypothetical protein
MQTPHYLRVVGALIVAATLPACSSGSDEPLPTRTEAAESTTPAAPPVEAPVAAATPSATTDASAPPADAAADGGLPFSSGPIAPPELPEGYA